MHASVSAFIKRRWLEQSGWIVSVTLHTLLLVLFWCWLVPEPAGNSHVTVDSRFGEAQEALPFDTAVDLAALEPHEAPGDPLDTLSDAAAQPRLLALDDTTGRLGPAALLPGDGILGSAMATDGTGEGSGFFGVSAAGKKFVYVVDASGSMEGRRFRRARYELNNSLKRLRAHQQYSVVFYNYDAHTMPNSELLFATRPNVQATQKWIAQVRPVGPTFPGNALKIALELEPDAIYFLSDGIFDPAVLEALRQTNAARIAIHTICFQDRVGEVVLQALAAQNGGKYRFVR